MTGAEIILTVAVILGPTLAVVVSLFMESRRNSARISERDVHLSYSDANARGNFEGVR